MPEVSQLSQETLNFVHHVLELFFRRTLDLAGALADIQLGQQEVPDGDEPDDLRQDRPPNRVRVKAENRSKVLRNYRPIVDSSESIKG